MADRKKIWIAEPQQFSAEAKQLLEEYFDLHIEKIYQEDIIHVLEKCDIFYFGLKHTITKSDMPKTPRCKIIICPVTGINHIDVETLEQQKIKLISLKGENTFLENIHATSEHTFALILALMRNIPSAIQSVKNLEWKRELFIGQELWKKTIGIIGFGRLGKQVAKIASGFGMHVLYYDTNNDKHNTENYNTFVTLDELLKKSDIVSLHINLTEENKNLVDLNFLKKMKKTAILINTSRGEIINETDLLHALRHNIIRAAALDVRCQEPKPVFTEEWIELLNDENKLLITPHIGGNTIESRVKTDIFVFEKLLKELQLV